MSETSVWFLCKFCKKTFPIKKYLILHKKNYHPQSQRPSSSPNSSHVEDPLRGAPFERNHAEEALAVDCVEQANGFRCAVPGSAQLNIAPKSGQDLTPNSKCLKNTTNPSENFVPEMAAPPDKIIENEKEKEAEILQNKIAQEFLIPQSVLQNLRVYNYNDDLPNQDKIIKEKVKGQVPLSLEKEREISNRDSKICQVLPLQLSPARSGAEETQELKKCKVNKVKRSFECKYCHKKLSSRRTFYDHERLHTGEKPFKCPHCSKQFSTPSQISRHKWKCSTRNLNKKTDHVANKNSNSPTQNVPVQGTGKWKCKVCALEFTNLSLSAVHNCHAQLRKKKLRPVTSKQKNIALPSSHNKLGQRSNKLIEKFLVPQNFHGKNVFVCSLCMKVFSYISLATSHVKGHELNGDLILDEGGPSQPRENLNCKEFFGMPILEKQTELPVKPPAVQIDKKFKGQVKEAIDMPIQLQAKDQLLESKDEVRTTTDTEQSYLEYVTTKINGKSCSYICNFCGKIFNFPSQAKRHIPLHTGERSYICSVPECQKTFLTVYDQWKHEREVHHFPHLNQKSRQKKAPKPRSSIDFSDSQTNSDRHPSPEEIIEPRPRIKPKGISKVEEWLAREANNLGRKFESEFEFTAPSHSSYVSSGGGREMNGGRVEIYFCNFCTKSFHQISAYDSHMESHVSCQDEGQEVEERGCDPGEKRYCSCKQVAYGEMVACDGKDCPNGEWFHFSCVGLTRTPRGQWFCSTCLQK